MKTGQGKTWSEDDRTRRKLVELERDEAIRFLRNCYWWLKSVPKDDRPDSAWFAPIADFLARFEDGAR